VTSAVASQSGNYLFTSGKEGSIVKWNLLTGKKLAAFHKIRPSTSKEKGKGKAVSDAKIQGHTDEVLALTMSDDGKYLISAGRDRCLGVWDAEKGEWITGLGGHLSHRDVISVRICVHSVRYS
jgi:ribosomal RNA-processing protein 9